MRILVTGANGYVGRTLARLLYDEHDVTVLDNLRYGRLRFREAELPRFTFRKEDIRNAEGVKGIFEEVRPEVVIHLAAIHYIPECESLPADAISINTLGTANLLQACAAGTRFVLASTAAVYAAEDTPHVEATSPIGPMDVYGITKLHAEQYVHYFSRKMGLDSRIVRLFNVIGPGETNPHLIPAMLAQMLKGNRVLRLGNCHPKRDYIHVQDAAAGFAKVALTAPVKDGVDVVNLGTGNAYSVFEMVSAFEGVIGEQLTIEADSNRVRASDRPFLAAATDKIRNLYGWNARFGIRESLEDIWREPDIPAELLERC